MTTTDPDPPEDHPRRRPEPSVPPTTWKRPESPFRAPEPIRDLIAAINDKARAAQLALLSMAAIGLYIVATAISTTDYDLFTNKSKAIPELHVQMPVGVTFVLAPSIFLAIHIFAMLRFQLLSIDMQALHEELALHVPDPRDRARCFRLLVNTEFVQMISGRPGDSKRTILLPIVFWFMISVIPLCALLLSEISALRLQSTLLSLIQRAIIIIDMGFLLWLTRSLRLPYSRSIVWAACVWSWDLRKKTPAERSRLMRQIRHPTGLLRRAADPIAAALVVLFIAIYAVPPGRNDFTVAIGRDARGEPWKLPGTLFERLASQPLDLVTCPDWGLARLEQ